MNYIKRLEAENKEVKEQLADIETRITEFRAYLLSDKFTGIDLDGDRKDWIGTSELDSFLLELRSVGINGF